MLVTGGAFFYVQLGQLPFTTGDIYVIVNTKFLSSDENRFLLCGMRMTHPALIKLKEEKICKLPLFWLSLVTWQS